ncbi:hypothetical protein BH23GEM10_BH23GEM10_14800 [soil metagenome]
MIGWQRVKLGARLAAGWIGDSEDGAPPSNTFTATLNPLLIRVTF